MHANDLPAGKRWNAETARRVLDDFEVSGMSRGEFARSRGVNAQRLWWWRKRLAEEEFPKAVSFIPAVVASGRDAVVSGNRSREFSTKFAGIHSVNLAARMGNVRPCSPSFD